MSIYTSILGSGYADITMDPIELSLKDTQPNAGKLPVVGYGSEELVRVPKIELERQYVSNPIAFSIISRYVYGVQKRGCGIVSDSEKDLEIIKEINSRLMLNSRVIPEMTRDMGVGGTDWKYVLLNDIGQVTRLPTMDFKYMDIAKSKKNGKAYPLTDKFMEPQYYVQYLEDINEVQDGWNSRLGRQLDKPCIKFMKNEIIRTNLFSIGDGMEGLGILEPMYRIAMDMQDVEKATTESILRLAYPIVYAMVGDERMYPSKQMIEDVAGLIHNVNERTEITLPYYAKLQLLEAKKPESLTKHLNYYKGAMITASGLPETLVTGSGEGSNKHTLSVLMNFVEGQFLMIHGTIKDSMDTQLIPIIQNSERLDGSLSFEWGEKEPASDIDDVDDGDIKPDVDDKRGTDDDKSGKS